MRGAASLARRVLPNFGMALFYLAWSGCFRLVAEAIAIHIFWATYGLQASIVCKVHLQNVNLKVPTSILSGWRSITNIDAL